MAKEIVIASKIAATIPMTKTTFATFSFVFLFNCIISFFEKLCVDIDYLLLLHLQCANTENEL